VSFVDEVRTALDRSPGRRRVAGHNFPGVGRSPADQVPALEHGIAALANVLELIALRIDELERRGDA
jgi:hypothetical protein